VDEKWTDVFTEMERRSGLIRAYPHHLGFRGRPIPIDAGTQDVSRTGNSSRGAVIQFPCPPATMTDPSGSRSAVAW